MPTHHILLAEDDFDLRMILAETLREQGHQVAEVADGTVLAQTLAAALDGGPPAIDLVVTDLHMPGWPPLGVLDALRSRPHCPAFILMSGFGDERERGQARQLGALGLLEKPFSPRALLALVNQS
jgi:CheY-like chemotaxis protein